MGATRTMVQTTFVAILTALAALILGLTQSLTTAITASLGLTAFQAIIVPGTGTPDPTVVPNYLETPSTITWSRVAIAAVPRRPLRAPTQRPVSSTTPRSGRYRCPAGVDSQARSGTSLWVRVSSI